MVIHKVIDHPAAAAELWCPYPHSTDGVKEVTYSNWFGGYFQETRNTIQSMAVEPESWLRMYPEFEVPDDQKNAWFKDRSGAVVGADLAKRFGWKVGDRIPIISPIYRKPGGAPWDFVIDGIYNSGKQGVDKTQLFFHYAYLNETFRGTGFMSDQVGWYILKVADPSTADQLAKRIDAMFANSQAETKTATEKSFVSDFAKQIGDIGSIMMAITGIVMFFILFVAGNAMAQSVRERINELGVLKTLGFGDGRILSLVLLESCSIAVVGGGLGLLLSWTAITIGGRSHGRPPADLPFPAARSHPRHGARSPPRRRNGPAAGASGQPHEDRRRLAPELIGLLT